MRYFLVALIFIFMPLESYSQVPRLEKAQRISKVMGLDDSLVELRADTVAAAKQQVATMLEQFRKNGLKDEVIKKILPAMERFVAACEASWDTKIAASIYAEGLVDELSDEELIEAEEYYSSPAGIKANNAIAVSQKRMLQYINEQTNKAIEPAMANFFEDVKRIATEARKK